MKSRDEIRDDLPLYALGALDAEERRALESALADDPTLAGELREWTALVALMALDAPAAPPPDLKTALVARARGSRATEVATGVAAEVRSGRPATLARRRLGWAVPLAAAALAVLALAAYREIGWRGRESDWRTQRERQAQAMAALERELQSAERSLAAVSATLRQREHDVDSLRSALGQAEETLSILRSPGLSLVSLKQTEDAPPAEAYALLSVPSGKAVFYAFDLPPVPADKAYELWWITEKEGPVMAGMFRPDAAGLGRVDAALPRDAGAITAAAVTVEVAAGVPKPQGPMVLLGTLRKS